MDATLANSRENLIKEIRYRCSYRGTLELDMVCRSLLPHLDAMDDSEILAIRDLLLQPENNLMDWLVDGQHKPVPDEFKLVVGLVRHYFKNRENAA